MELTRFLLHFHFSPLSRLLLKLRVCFRAGFPCWGLKWFAINCVPFPSKLASKTLSTGRSTYRGGHLRRRSFYFIWQNAISVNFLLFRKYLSTISSNFLAVHTFILTSYLSFCQWALKYTMEFQSVWNLLNVIAYGDVGISVFTFLNIFLYILIWTIFTSTD